MRNFTLYHSNALDSGVIEGGSWEPNLPLANLYIATTTRRARSTDAQLTSTQLQVGLSETITSFGIQIISTNLSSAARYRISWYSDSSFAAPSLIDTTDWIPVGISIDWTNVLEWFDWLNPNFWLGAQPFVDPDNQGRDVRHTFDEPTSLQYVKIEFDDTTNADGFVEIGYLYIGHAFIPSVNIGPEPVFKRVSLSSMQEAIGGAAFFNRRGSRKSLQVAWAVLPKDEILNDIDAIIQLHDIDKPVYVDLDPENTLQSGRNTAFLARIAQLPEAQLLQVQLETDTAAAIGFEFIQVL